MDSTRTPLHREEMNVYGVPFLGTEALAAGAVNKHQLRTRYRSVFPGVYVEPDLELTLQQRAKAAWLWSGREAVIAGLAASALHGAEWIDGQAPVELIWSNARPPQGIRTRRDRLAVGEVMSLTGMRVTTPVRTAFDLGRLIRGDEGIERLDALGQVARFSAADVEAVADRHRGHRVRHDCGERSRRTTLAQNHPGRRGCDCCSFAPGIRGRVRRSPSATRRAGRSTSSTWGGKT